MFKVSNDPQPDANGCLLYDELNGCRSYALRPSYKLLYNVGNVLATQGDPAAASSAFERYLAEGRSDINERRKRDVEAELANLEEKIARLEIIVDEGGAAIVVDGCFVGRSPLAPLSVRAGRHTIEVALAGYCVETRQVAAPARERLPVRFVLSRSGDAEDGGSVSRGEQTHVAVVPGARGCACTSVPTDDEDDSIRRVAIFALACAMALFRSPGVRRSRRQSPNARPDSACKALDRAFRET